jgi:hypothetical protein
MKALVVAFIMSVALMAAADDLGALRAAAGRYVVAMRAALALPKTADCAEISAKGSEYATAKIVYYKAARQAMPSLVQMAKGEKTDNRYGEDLIELFRGSGEEEDEESTVMLMSKLRGCENSNQVTQARKTIENAQQIAEQFLKDFGRLEGA